MAISYYDILGVPRFASDEALRTAYLRLAGGSHPDLNRVCPDAESRFKAIQIAYETLRDPVSRQRYDLGIVEEAVVHSHGHQRDRRSAEPWPYEDAHDIRDVDFDITANQSTLSGRSRKTTTVAMLLLVVVAVGVSILSIGRSSTRSAKASGHLASQPANTPARADVNARSEAPFDLVLSLASEEGVSTARLSKASQAFGFSMLVTDPSLGEQSSATRRAINVEAEQPLSEADQTGSDPVVAIVPQELLELTLDDSEEMPLDLPALNDGLLGQSDFSMQFTPQATGAADLDFLDYGASNPASPPEFIDAPATWNRQELPEFLPHSQASAQIADVTGLDPSTVLSSDGEHNDPSYLFDVPFVVGGDQEPDHPWKRLIDQGLSAANYPSVSGRGRPDHAPRRQADSRTDSPVISGVSQHTITRKRVHRFEDPASLSNLPAVHQNAIGTEIHGLRRLVPGVVLSVPGSQPSSSPPTRFNGSPMSAWAPVTSGLQIPVTAYGEPEHVQPWLTNPTPSIHAPASPTGFAPQ